jgi:hypothetical protein
MAVVNDYTALVSGQSWSGKNVLNAPVVLTYSFASEVPSYLSAEGYNSSELASFQPFNATEQAVARDALRQWADVSGIAFVEVTNGSGELVFSKLDLMTGTLGFAKRGDRSFDDDYNYDNVKAGDVFIDLNHATEPYVLLHEIGHALGLKHPFDGDPVLASALDSRTNTVMSYTGNPRNTLALFDIQAVQSMYGDASSDVNWSWNPATAELTQIGKSTNETIFGTGQRDIVRGEDGDDRIAGYAGADRLDGGSGDDLIFGGAGDDVLIGGRGNDVLIGGDYLSDAIYNGFDAADYSSSASSIDVDLDRRYEKGRQIQAFASGADIGTDTLWGIHKIIGSNFADVIRGSIFSDILLGGGGDDILRSMSRFDDADVLDGGAGSDWADYSLKTTAVSVTLNGENDVIVTVGGMAEDTIRNIENLLGGSGNDVLTGDSQANELQGLGGNDTLTGRAGNDVLDGGAGWDTALFSGNYAQYGIVVSGLTATLVGPDGTDVVKNVETFVFNDRTVAITGAVRNDDFNGDSEADILWRNDNGATFLWSSTPAAGAGFTGQDIGVVGSDWHIQAAADFNGDGKADILWRNDNGATFLWNSPPTAGVGFTGQDIGPAGNDWHIQGAADFNGDGKADILWRNDNGGIYLWNSTPGAGVSFTGQDIGAAGNDWRFQDAADFNGDGKADILWRNDNGTALLWNSSPAAGVGFTGQTIGVPLNERRIQEAADFNGDGKADILWRNDNGGTYLWNSTPAAGVNFTFQDTGVVGNDWHIQDAADFNSDGKADILWRNDNGATFLWSSSPGAGVGFTGQGIGDVSNDWHIQA